MENDLFAAGEPQTIADVVENKDQRAALQTKLCQQYPTATLIVLKMNIPGPIKNNAALQAIFAVGQKELLTRIGKKDVHRVEYQANWSKNTGNESFLVVDREATELKKITTNFEEEFVLGRLFDADVLSAQTDLKPMTRHSLGLPVRKCFLCGRPAKECSRSRRHSIQELQSAINAAWQKFETTRFTS